MKNLRKSLILIALLISNAIFAAIPTSYYTGIDGDKYLSLKDDLYNIIKNHKVLGYSSLWTYYPSTYYHLDNKTQVLDMYSNTKRYYNGSSAVAGMNKEHTVPKSWWGGSTSAAPGNDLYNVIPSDQDANSRKSNYPLGIVRDQSWTNGVTTIGKGTVNGYSSTFFEPCDEYKGDFARIYFYMAVCYPDLNWDTNDANAYSDKLDETLKAWIIPMLLEWSENDPVDASEIQRNEDVYKVQGNRNPFIDYPVLAEYIWGSRKAEIFNLSEHKPNEGNTSVLYASIPKISLAGGTSSNPKEVVEGTTLVLKGGASSATLHIRTNGGAWQEFAPTKGWNSTTQTEYYTEASTTLTINDDLKLEAYCTQEEREPSEVVTYYYKVVDYTNDYLLYEPFDEVTGGNNTSTQGSSAVWNGNSNFPTTNGKAYQAGNALKLGTGSSLGSITSRELTFAGGTATVIVDVKGWTAVEGPLNITLGNETKSISYTATMEGNFETVTAVFENVVASPTLTIATSTKRAFIDNIRVQAGDLNAIASPTANVKSDGSCYDLMGRRILESSAKGLYIRDGRKFVK